MGFSKSGKEIANRASAYLKAELRRGEVTYAELARRVRKHDLEKTEANKLSRGIFPVTLLVSGARGPRVGRPQLDNV
jgi:hypothetical protein